MACLAAFKISKSNVSFNYLEQATFSAHKRHHVIKKVSHADHSKKPKIKLKHYFDTA